MPAGRHGVAAGQMSYGTASGTVAQVIEVNRPARTPRRRRRALGVVVAAAVTLIVVRRRDV
ncbi:hypothetical protein OIE66_24795 [Nonomuraea sp. NBC_01738]|uniref:hypothetical protein n=1 Tax=Nonomuraea sp. NBC_01738 TaxID=2976003 RepID=UPI002E139953|nr:hypothetical protein OIE66_24795 [Nonomuraea sp. NBC_01738]